MGKLLWHGTKLGAGTALILAASFTNCLMLSFYFFSSNKGLFSWDSHLGLFIFAGLIIGYLLGVLPAILVGAFIGLSIGVVFTLIKNPLTNFKALLIGFVISLVPIILLNILDVAFPNKWLLIMAGVICFAASGWMGIKLNQTKKAVYLEKPGCLESYVLLLGAHLLSVLLPGLLAIPLLPILGVIISRKNDTWRHAGATLSAIYVTFLLGLFINYRLVSL